MQPFNFLAGLQQAPARAPIEVSYKKPGKFVNTLGRILDAVATAGGAAPGYKTNVLGAQKQAEADAVRTAAQRLAADPDDQEAFVFLAARDPKGAVEFRDSLRPQAELKEAGGRLYRVEPDRQSAKALTEATAGGGIPSQIQIARAMANPNTPPLEREWLGRQIDPAVYQRDAAGNLIAVPKLGAPANDLNTMWARMIQQESGGRQTDAQGRPLTSSAGAIGIAQVMPGTAPEAAALAGLPFDENRYRTDPDYNQAIGRAYFNQQVRTFGDPARAAAAYNAGPEAVRRAVQQGGENWLSLLPAETQNYVARVAGQGGARVVAANKGFRPGRQNGLPGQFGPDGRFYPDPLPKGKSKGSAGAENAAELAVLDEGIADLDRAIKILESGNNVTGPLIGLIPDAVLNLTNPETVTAGEAVARVSQKELRQILGGQFAMKEGEQLIKRAFNTGQSEGENLKRVKSLRRQMVARRNELAGGAGSVVVTAPNGKSYAFPNEQAAAAFRQRAGIR